MSTDPSHWNPRNTAALLAQTEAKLKRAEATIAKALRVLDSPDAPEVTRNRAAAYALRKGAR